MSYETTAQLLTLLQEEVADTSPSPATQARYLALLDIAHKAIVSGGGELNLDDTGNPMRRPYVFSWAKAENPISFTLEPKQTGTGAITQDSATATLSINSATKDVTGWHIQFNGAGTVYRIVTHSGTTATLNAQVVEDTNAASSFEAYKLIYTVAPATGSILMPVDGLRVQWQKTPLSLVDESELLDKFPLSDLREGKPQLAALVKQNEASMVVRFSHYPKERNTIDVHYVPRPAALATTPTPVNPIIPNPEKRRVLVHLAAFYHLRKRDDDRALSHLKSAQYLFDAITTEDRQFVSAQDTMFGYIAPFPGGFSGSSYHSYHVDIF